MKEANREIGSPSVFEQICNLLIGRLSVEITREKSQMAEMELDKIELEQSLRIGRPSPRLEELRVKYGKSKNDRYTS